MTAQIADTVLYQGERYHLVGGGPLYDPRQDGMEPSMFSTACWRGYICTFAVTGNGLLLHELTLHVAGGAFRPINGVRPHAEGGRATYRDLNLALAHSGELLLGAEPLPAWYTHMGYPQPHGYATVIALAFEGGRLIEVRDLSADMAALRARLAQGLGPLEPPRPGHTLPGSGADPA